MGTVELRRVQVITPDGRRNAAPYPGHEGQALLAGDRPRQHGRPKSNSSPTPLSAQSFG